MKSTAEESVSYRTNSEIFKTNDIKDVLNIPFVNGVYTGKTLKEILDENSSYLLYLLRCNQNKEIEPYPGLDFLIENYYEKAIEHGIKSYSTHISKLQIALEKYRKTREVTIVSF